MTTNTMSLFQRRTIYEVCTQIDLKFIHSSAYLDGKVLDYCSLEVLASLHVRFIHASVYLDGKVLDYYSLEVLAFSACEVYSCIGVFGWESTGLLFA
mmetsp:Transcript_19792/g.24133  ORF Transcript_19792/g.24133 Transcript_19792/m.24133 type:complete len:97 (+) Transcript_19792:2710-3000(+)